MAKKYGLNILASLSCIPNWMYQNCPTPNSQWPWWTSPIDLGPGGSALFDGFASEMVERYRPNGTKDPNSGYGISHWQIWNEPDIGFWFDCHTGELGNLQTYAYLLRSAYNVIKSIDPGAQVVIGGLTHLNPVAELEELYGYLPSKPFDIIDIHYYEDGSTLSGKMNGVLDVRDSHGDQNKEVWVTETSSSHQNPSVTQSEYLSNVFGQLDNLDGRNLKNGFWWPSRGYFWDNNEWPDTRTHAAFDANFYPKPFYFDFGEWLGVRQFKGEVQAIVSGAKVSFVLPATILDEAAVYVVFFASPTKMVTELPIRVRVVP